MFTDYPNITKIIRIEVELGKDPKRIAPPKFDGKTIGDGVEAWFIEMEKYFELRNLSNDTKVMWLAYQLIGEATTWWDSKNVEKKLLLGETTWELFLQLLRIKWLPQLFFDKKMTEFQNLIQGNMTIIQYWKEFANLLKYMPHYQEDTLFCITKSILGLKLQIGADVDMHDPQTIDEAFRKAIK